MINCEKITDSAWESDPMWEMLLPLEDLVFVGDVFDGVVGRLTDRLCKSLEKGGYSIEKDRLVFNDAQETRETLLRAFLHEVKHNGEVLAKASDRAKIERIKRELGMIDGFEVECSYSNTEQHINHNYYLRKQEREVA